MQSARADLEWVEEDDLPLLQQKEPTKAGALSFLTGGGGQLYVGDYRTGFGLTAATVGMFAAAVAVTPLAWVPFVAVGSFSAINAWRKARAINRYLAAKWQHESVAGPHPAAYRLLAAMSAADPHAQREALALQRQGILPAPQPGQPAPPARHGELIERLRKLATIRAAGVLGAHEHRERKIDLLSKACAGLEREAMDDLLYELLPLLEEGALDNEDVTFIKDLSER